MAIPRSTGQELIWYIPKSTFDAFPVKVKEEFDLFNHNVPYRTSPGAGITWIKTESFGWFYACRCDAGHVEFLASLVPDLPEKTQEFRNQFSNLRLKEEL